MVKIKQLQYLVTKKNSSWWFIKGTGFPFLERNCWVSWFFRAKHWYGIEESVLYLIAPTGHTLSFLLMLYWAQCLRFQVVFYLEVLWPKFCIEQKKCYKKVTLKIMFVIMFSNWQLFDQNIIPHKYQIKDSF